MLGVVLFPRENPSLMCHGYCQIMHTHSSWWYVGFEPSEVCL